MHVYAAPLQLINQQSEAHNLVDLFQLCGVRKLDDLFQPCGYAVATAHEVPWAP